MTPMLLAPLELVYASLVRARNARFDRMASHRLRWPVVSVGNLSVGGAGKTPLVICLARLLAGKGVDVLSRGYGRSPKTAERVNADGNAERFGDEPLLIAREAGVPVYVGASRYEAGLLAEREIGGQGVHLLDDGFQHRQLARNLDIVVVHRSDLSERLLPAGRLREPLSSLRRADVIVLRQEDAELELPLRAYARKGCLFWRMRRTLSLTTPPANIMKRVIAFCAIARPAEFFAALAAAGMEMVERIAFRDHHRYTAADIDRLAEAGRRQGCDAFVVTGKDEVKLDAAMRLRLNTIAPLRTAGLVVQMEDENAVLDQLLALLRI